MPFKNMTKRLGILTVAAVAALSLIPTTSASAADPTPAKPNNVSIQRVISGGNVTIKNGESVTITVDEELDSTYFNANPISGSTTFEASWAGPALNGTTQTNTWYYWSASPWIPGSNNSSTWTNSAGTTMTSLTVSVSRTYKNTSGSDKVLAVDASTMVIKRGGTTINGTTPIVRADKNISPYAGDVTSPFTITAIDGSTHLSFSLCLNSTTGLADGDAVTAVVTATKDGAPISTGTISDGNVDQIEFNNLSGTLHAPLSTTMSAFSIDGSMYAPNTGSYAVTAVLKKGATVIGGACAAPVPGGPSSAFPTSFSKVGTGTMAVTSPVSSTLTSSKLSNSSFMATGSSVDGSGGEYYWGLNSANKHVLTRMIAGTGIDTKFGGTTVTAGSGAGYIVLPFTLAGTAQAPMSFVTGVGSYTSTNSKWIATQENYNGQTPTFSLAFGSNTANSVVQKTVTFASLKTICGDQTVSYADLFAISTPTDVPVVEVTCGKWVQNQETAKWVVIAKVNPTTGALTAITTLGSNSTCLATSNGMGGPSLPVSASVNSGAAAGKQAVALYAGQASTCGGMAPTIARGFLVTLKTDGSLGYKKEFATLASIGLSGVTPAPSIPRSLRFAPGLSVNEWVSVVRLDATKSRVLNFGATGTATAGSTITLDSPSSYTGLMSSSLVPLKVLSNKSVVFLRLGYSMDGTTIVSSIAKAPTATVAGAKTLVTGQGIKSTGGNANARNILNYSYNTKATTVGWFGVMGATSFKSAKWTLPTS